MARPRVYSAVLVVLWLALLALVGLQLYWTHELGLAHEQRLEQSLARAAGEFRLKFDDDLTTLLSDLKPYHPARPALLPRSPFRYRLYHVDANARQLSRFEQTTLRFEPAEWPAAWAGLPVELSDYGDELRSLTARRWFNRPWLAVPGLPLLYRAAQDPEAEEGERRGGFLLVELIPLDALPDSWGPLLGEAVARLRLANLVLCETQPAPGSAPSRLRLPLPGNRAQATTGVDEWWLEISPLPGAFDQAVDQLRYRNLAAGFGVALVLGGGILFLMQTARRADRLREAQAGFVAAFSHELRTPLTAITMLAGNLRDGLVEAPADISRYGEMLASQSNRLRDRIEDILAFAAGRAAPVSLAPVALAALVEAALRDEAPLLRGLGVETVWQDDLPAVLADANGLRMVLTNLFSNAAKYAASGGRLRLEAAASGSAQVELRVIDFGPGLPREELDRLFEPFFRGSAGRRAGVPGSGLGLHLVRQRVEAMHGTIQVDSPATGGLCFKIRLPAHFS